jgi:hypothetical protein
MRPNKIIRSTFGPSWQQLSRRLTCIALTLLLGCGGGGGGSSGGGSGGSGSGPSGKLGPAIAYSTNGFWWTQVAVADLDGDGRNDVVTFSDWSFGPQMVAIYHQDNTGGFNVVSSFDASATFDFVHLQRIAVGDLNNDGKTDLVLTGECNSCLVGFRGKFTVLYQHPTTGDLLPGQSFTVSAGSAGNAEIADINSDGRNDLIIINAEGKLSIFYQLPNGTLGPEVIYDKGAGFLRGEIHIADMDNDGDKDIVVQSGMKQFEIIKQDSTATPGILVDTPEYYDVQTTYWPQFDSFAVGDLNGDSKNDVVVLDPGNNGTMNVFLQNNSGKLDPPVLSVPWFAPPYGVELADINGDGLTDILGDQVNPGVPPMGSVYVLYQAPNHTFQDPVAYSFPTISGGGSIEHQGLAIGDVTGDGKPDAVMTWHNEGLFVLPNITR